MSLLYLVDGYNALRGSGLFDNDKLQNARDAFLKYLEVNRPQGSLRNKLIVVFDAKQDVSFGYSGFSFEVIFTKGESADEKIKKMVRESSSAKTIVVVSDDKGIAMAVRPMGAKIMSVSAFINNKKVDAKSKPSNGVPATEGKSELNIVERESITRELSRIWLKNKKSF